MLLFLLFIKLIQENKKYTLHKTLRKKNNIIIFYLLYIVVYIVYFTTMTQVDVRSSDGNGPARVIFQTYSVIRYYIKNNFVIKLAQGTANNFKLCKSIYPKFGSLWYEPEGINEIRTKNTISTGSLKEKVSTSKFREHAFLYISHFIESNINLCWSNISYGLQMLKISVLKNFDSFTSYNLKIIL